MPSLFLRSTISFNSGDRPSLTKVIKLPPLFTSNPKKKIKETLKAVKRILNLEEFNYANIHHSFQLCLLTVEMATANFKESLNTKIVDLSQGKPSTKSEGLGWLTEKIKENGSF
mmetsp:Transcript_20961/g.32496  ORF Transcript_20961/g.32496 Transcript_20961/m.32496 type:complete len:114 (+) Transcript_20961:4163-4504(+)